MEILKKVESLIASNDLEGLKSTFSEKVIFIRRQRPIAIASFIDGGIPVDSDALNFVPWQMLDLSEDKTVYAGRVKSDGNCLYNACSLALTGKEDMCHLLRALTSAELFLHSAFYASHPHFTTLLNTEVDSGLFETFFCHALTHEASDLLADPMNNYSHSVRYEALKNCQVGRWSPFICVLAISSVLGLPVFSFYPESGGRKYAVNLSNAKISPRDSDVNDYNNNEVIRLLWSKAGGCKNDLTKAFHPNHIVPLFIVGKDTRKQLIKSISSLKEEENKTKVSSLPKKLPGKQAKIMFPKMVVPESPLNVVSLQEPPSHSNDTMHHEAVITDDKSQDHSPSHFTTANDFGSLYMHAGSLTDQQKYEIMLNVWKPGSKFSFPTRQIQGKNRKFVYSWLSNYPWLAYSKLLDGALCLPCVLFGRKTGQNSCKLDKLMKNPLTDWSSASYKLKEHQSKSDVHKAATETMNRFKNLMECKEKSIDEIHNESVDRAVQQNRLKLGSIAKTVLLCAKQNIPLRGHRDDSQHYDAKNCGNFQALLDFRVESGDNILAEHFKTAPRNATFRSKTTQNDLISCMSEEINKQIVDEIKECGPYSILADEVTDCSNQQLMPLVLRYVDRNGDIQERSMKLLPCDTGTTGEALKTKIVDCITNDFNLDIMDCRGQCYDGAANMSGKYSGVASRILRINDLALYTHCASHRLNLAVAASCKIQCIKNMMEFVRKVANFFHYPKRQLLLEEMVRKHLKNYSHTKLIDPCETRWILRIDALERFIEMYVPITEAMRTIRDNQDKRWDDCSSDAFTYFFALQNFDFIMTLLIVRMLLGYTRSATIQLQSSHLDFVEGIKQVDVTIKTLKNVRDSIDTYHSIWFQDAARIAEKMDASVTAPRTCQKQIYRANAPCNDTESYFKINVAIPFLDHLLQELSDRFSPQNCVAIQGMSILPQMMKSEYRQTFAGQKRSWEEACDGEMKDNDGKVREAPVNNSSCSSGSQQQPHGGVTNEHRSSIESTSKIVRIQRCDKQWKKHFENFCNLYARDMPDKSFISHEVDNWESTWMDVPDKNLPKNISETLKMTNKISFPNIYTCLKILAVLPITSCTCERSASSVRLMKTYLRSRMTSQRLNGLATVYTHKDIEVDINKVINTFATKCRRRMKLKNILDTDKDMERDDEAIVSEMY